MSTSQPGTGRGRVDAALLAAAGAAIGLGANALSAIGLVVVATLDERWFPVAVAAGIALPLLQLGWMVPLGLAVGRVRPGLRLGVALAAAATVLAWLLVLLWFSTVTFPPVGQGQLEGGFGGAATTSVAGAASAARVTIVSPAAWSRC